MTRLLAKDIRPFKVCKTWRLTNVLVQKKSQISMLGGEVESFSNWRCLLWVSKAVGKQKR